MSYLTNPYRYAASIPNCFNSGTGSTYIDNSPRITIVTQIGTAGTCQWLDRQTDTVSFWFKTDVSCTGNVYAYQINAGGTMSTSTTYLDTSTVTSSFVEYPFTFPSTITFSASTAVGVIRSSGSGMMRVQLTEVSSGDSLLDCDINAGWGVATGESGNLNMCIDE